VCGTTFSYLNSCNCQVTTSNCQ